MHVDGVDHILSHFVLLEKPLALRSMNNDLSHFPFHLLGDRLHFLSRMTPFFSLWMSSKNFAISSSTRLLPMSKTNKLNSYY